MQPDSRRGRRRASAGGSGPSTTSPPGVDAEIVARTAGSRAPAVAARRSAAIRGAAQPAAAARAAHRATAQRTERPRAAARSRQPKPARHDVVDRHEAGRCGAVTIQGRSTTLIALSDFVGNLGNGALLKKPIEIVNSQVDASRSGAGTWGRGGRIDQFHGESRIGSRGTRWWRRCRGCRPCRAGRAATAGRGNGRDAVNRTTTEWNEVPVVAINISLNKLPWYSQVGIFVVLSLAAVGAFWNWYARDAMASHRRARGAAGDDQPDHRAWARDREAAARVPPRSAALEAQLDRLRAVLPEEQDVADLLRRVQAMATQSRLTIRGFTPRAVTRRQMHAEWPIGLAARRHLSRSRYVPRTRQQVPPHHQRGQHPDHARRTVTVRRVDDHRRVHSDDLRADRGATSTSGRRARGAAAKTE